MNKELIEVQSNLYSQWLTKQNRKPKKFIAIINGLSNDLKKLWKLTDTEHLFLISNPDRLTKLLNEWLEHPPYKAKNDRGNNYYSAPFKKYIKYRTENQPRIK